MIQIIGKFNTAICYTNELEPTAYAQIETVCNEQAFEKSKIRIMPDVHAGKGCTIGTTMTIVDKVVPNMVGVDIGCGMCTVNLGNADWNYSAPHGAGRLMSRSAAFEKLTMEEYEKQMAGIYTTCVNTATLDESPMAYKNMEDIVANIEPTAEIIAHIKPIYNFKAAE